MKIKATIDTVSNNCSQDIKNILQHNGENQVVNECPMTSMPTMAEISDEEAEGMFFLFYYDETGNLLSDYCFLSLNEAKETAFLDYRIKDSDWVE